jgi:hypothetical protein
MHIQLQKTCRQKCDMVCMACIVDQVALPSNVKTADCECMKQIFVICLWCHIFLLSLHLRWVPSGILKAFHRILICSILLRQCVKLHCCKILVCFQPFTLRNKLYSCCSYWCAFNLSHWETNYTPVVLKCGWTNEEKKNNAKTKKHIMASKAITNMMFKRRKMTI